MAMIEFDCGALGPQGEACTRQVTADGPHAGPHRGGGVEWAREATPLVCGRCAYLSGVTIGTQGWHGTPPRRHAPGCRPLSEAECATFMLGLARGSWLAAMGATLDKPAKLVRFAGGATGPATQLALGTYIDVKIAEGVPSGMSPPVAPVATPAATPVRARLSVADRARLSDAEARAMARTPEGLALARAARAARTQVTATPAALTAAQERAAAAKKARAALDGAIQIALASGDGTYPHGLLAAWRPSGEVMWSKVAEAAGVAGVAPPAQRSDRAIASDAVALLAGNGLKVATITRGRKWSVYRPANRASVGDSVGEARLVCELVGESLQLEGPADLCAAVREAFSRARSEATLGSTEVSTWLTGLLSGMRAVATVYGRWVAPGAPSEMWVRLAGSLAAAGLPVPAKPAAVASREDVADEVAAGLRAEVTAQITAIQARITGLGPKGAVSALGEVAAQLEKLALYEMIAGPMPGERAALKALDAQLQPLVSDAAARAAGLEIDAAPLPSEKTRLAPCQID